MEETTFTRRRLLFRAGWPRWAVLTAVLLLIACNDVSVEPTTTGLPPPTPTHTTETQIPAPTIVSMSVNGVEAELENGEYVIPEPVNPADVLSLEVVVRGGEGVLTTLGFEVAYPASMEGTTVVLDLVIPEGLKSTEIPIELNGVDSAILRFMPGPDWPPRLVLGSGSRDEDGRLAGVVGEALHVSVFDLNGADTVRSVQATQVFRHQMQESSVPLDPSESQRLITNDRLRITEVSDGVELVADHPGRYLVQVTAEDAAGNRSETTLIAEISPKVGFSIRGVGTGPIQPDVSYLDQYLSIVERLNASLVQIGVFGTTPSLSSSDVHNCDFVWSPESNCNTASPDDIAVIVDAAHERGMEVMLKANVIIGNYLPSWQQDADWDDWFSLTEGDPSYANWVLEWAGIAEANGVEHLVIGNEMVNSHVAARGWRDLIAAIREVYNGQVSYADNYWVFFNNGRNQPFPACDLLDYQGLNFYYRGSGGAVGGPPENDPSAQVMRENLRAQVEEMFLPAVEHCVDKPVVLTEISISNYDGANQMPEQTDGTGQTRDDVEAAEFFGAVLEVVSEYPWMRGVVVWEYQMAAEPWSVASNGILPDFRDRPAEDLVRVFFAAPK